MNIDWATVLASVGTSTLAIGGVGWLLKTFITHEMAKALEDHRQALQLNTQAQHFQFSRLHERRAEIIHELYKRIIEIRRYCHLTVDFGAKNEKEDREANREIFRMIMEMNNYVGENGLYLPQTIKDQYSHMFTKGVQSSLFAVGIAEMLDHRFPNAPEDRIKLIKDTFRPELKKQLAEFDTLIQTIEAEFRNLLGIR